MKCDNNYIIKAQLQTDLKRIWRTVVYKSVQQSWLLTKITITNHKILFFPIFTVSDRIILNPAGPKEPKGMVKRCTESPLTVSSYCLVLFRWSNKWLQSWHLKPRSFVGCHFSITPNSLSGKLPTSVSVLQLQEITLSINCSMVVLWSSGNSV